MYGNNAYDTNDNNNDTTFIITSTKLYFPIVTLSTEDNAKLAKQLNEGFKRPIYWNTYKTEIALKDSDNNNLIKNYLKFILFLLMIIKKLKDTSAENTLFQE